MRRQDKVAPPPGFEPRPHSSKGCRAAVTPRRKATQRPTSLPDPDNRVMPERTDDVDRIGRGVASGAPRSRFLPSSGALPSNSNQQAPWTGSAERSLASTESTCGSLTCFPLSDERKALPIDPYRVDGSNACHQRAMTNRINRLVARGLVSRQADPEDGRRVVVVLAEAGRKLVDRAFQGPTACRAASARAPKPQVSAPELGGLLRSLSLHIEQPDN